MATRRISQPGFVGKTTSTALIRAISASTRLGASPFLSGGDPRVGQRITCAKLANLDTMLISTAKIIELTDYFDRGCRTQITTEVRNARQMAHNWGGGLLGRDMMTLLHRVVFYGDHLDSAGDLCTLMGISLVEEGALPLLYQEQEFTVRLL